jgi:hypothetical protein
VINYYQEHKDEFNKYNDEDKNPSLYYLDEVVHLDANKKNVEMNSNNSDIIKDGLILYALRRDGILMVSDENGHYQYAVNYKESDITLPSYHPTTEDPSKRVFYTTQKPADLNVASTENFNSITYRIGEYDPETDRIYVAYEYTNSIGNQEVVTNVFKTKGNYADIVYSDGCDEDAFATITYTNVLIGDEAPTLEDFTPEREGYEFLGWDKEIETTTTGDVVYTAQWRKIEVPEEDDEDDYYDPMPEDLPDPMEGFINPKTGVTLLLLIPLIASIIFITKLKRKRVQA